MVTAVNVLAGEEKRLTMNGWWVDDWLPSFDDDIEQFANGYSDWLEYFAEDDAKCLELTDDQKQRLNELEEGCKNGEQLSSVSKDRCEKLLSFQARANKVFYPEEYEEIQMAEL